MQLITLKKLVTCFLPGIKLTMITTDNNSKITIVGVHQDNIILEYYPVTPLNCFKCFKKHLLNLTAIKSKDAPFNSLYLLGNLF